MRVHAGLSVIAERWIAAEFNNVVDFRAVLKAASAVKAADSNAALPMGGNGSTDEAAIGEKIKKQITQLKILCATPAETFRRCCIRSVIYPRGRQFWFFSQRSTSPCSNSS